MVSVRENRAEVVITAAGERQPGPAEGWVTCPVVVEQSLAIEGQANLLADAPGRTMTALLPSNAARLLPSRGRWRVHAELVHPGVLRVTNDPAHLEQAEPRDADPAP